MTMYLQHHGNTASFNFRDISSKRQDPPHFSHRGQLRPHPPGFCHLPAAAPRLRLREPHVERGPFLFVSQPSQPPLARCLYRGATPERTVDSVPVCVPHLTPCCLWSLRPPLHSPRLGSLEALTEQMPYERMEKSATRCVGQGGGLEQEREGELIQLGASRGSAAST